MKTAGAPVAAMSPEVEVMVLVLPVALRPRRLVSGVRSRSANVIAPVLFCRSTALPADELTVVLPKLAATDELTTNRPTPALFWRFVVPLENVPLATLKTRPLAPPFDETEVKVRPSAVFTSEAAPPPAPDWVSEPPPAVTVPELLVLSAKALVVVTLSVVKLMVRVGLFVRSTPMLPVAFLLTVVAANERLAFELAMLMPVLTGLVMVAAPVTFVAPPPPAWRKPAPLAPETESVPKVRVPAGLFWRLMPSVASVQEVLPKLMLAVEPVTRTHCVVGSTTNVPPVTVSEPAIWSRATPCPALDVELMLVKVAASVPLSRLSACPLPPSATSLAVSVPKPEAVEAMSAPVVLLMEKPRSVLLLPTPRLTALVAGAVVTSETVAGLELFAGSGSE